MFRCLSSIKRGFNIKPCSQISFRRIHDNGRNQAWAQAVEKVEELVGAKGKSAIDFKSLVGNDVEFLSDNIKRILTSGHPVINTISSYYFNAEGKHIRPLIVLLMSQATSLVSHPNGQFNESRLPLTDINLPISSHFAKNGERQVDDFSFHTSPPSTEIFKPTPDSCVILPSQRRLAEITEMIHTASLFHDDVIDDSKLRRGKPSCNSEFGNKMAILGGDYLLARASVSLARLRHPDSVELMATAIANLVEGELLQLKDIQPSSIDYRKKLFENYIEKTYLKTASLIANSCKAAALLGGAPESVAQHAFDYGKNIGIAFQLTDDLLDLVVSSDDFGKPVGADLKLGISTAPVLFASEQFPELHSLIDRKFSLEGDAEKARELVLHSQGLERTRLLALEYADLAIKSASQLPPSLSRDALIQLSQKVTERKK
ncbi:coq1 putative hexaprenyl diphosphate synthase [Entomophthora muscae]|uniref:Coq1 putative hexaprenyl diphosphate synthase n=1 Tax=Entomophthora muscae TaxID=34485 RepID=A0ACC2SKA0_9FUNG|nr:coq1 putative hexaprenyl diphosphate synthase [Entomophthora muscae]